MVQNGHYLFGMHRFDVTAMKNDISNTGSAQVQPLKLTLAALGLGIEVGCI